MSLSTLAVSLSVSRLYIFERVRDENHLLATLSRSRLGNSDVGGSVSRFLLLSSSISTPLLSLIVVGKAIENPETRETKTVSQ